MTKFEKLETEIAGVSIVKHHQVQDHRGSFSEQFNSSVFQEFINATIEVKQLNFSRSFLGVVRGIHFTVEGDQLFKFVRCTKGAVYDVAIDFRKNSPTYGQKAIFELRADKTQSLIIPPGVGHGFQSLSEGAELSYLVTSQYDPLLEVTINPLDPDLKLDWPVNDLILSEKDRNGISFLDYTRNL